MIDQSLCLSPCKCQACRPLGVYPLVQGCTDCIGLLHCAVKYALHCSMCAQWLLQRKNYETSASMVEASFWGQHGRVLCFPTSSTLEILHPLRHACSPYHSCLEQVKALHRMLTKRNGEENTLMRPLRPCFVHRSSGRNQRTSSGW